MTFICSCNAHVNEYVNQIAKCGVHINRMDTLSFLLLLHELTIVLTVNYIKDMIITSKHITHRGKKSQTL